MARSFFAQVGHYLSGEVLRQVASVVSFPTFTRLFTTAQYGLMSVVNSTVPMVMPFAKCGVSFATERYYASYRAKGQETEFFATTILFSCGYCVVFCLLYELVLGAALFVIPAAGTARSLLQILMLVGGQIFLKAQLAVILQIARAKQESLLYNAAATFEAYASVGVSLTLVLVLGIELRWFFVGQMIATSLTLAFALFRLSRALPIRRALYRKEIVRESLRYGTPMIWNEIAAVAQAMADRYVILVLLDEASVGIYSVGFNLSSIVIALTFSPVYSTLGPVVFQKHADGGDDAARAFLEPVCRWTLRLLFPIIAGVQVTAAPLVVLLASAKYAEAANITRLNFAGLVVWGLSQLLGMAILISKQTRVHRNVVLFGTALNVVLAIGLVKVLGLEGAALAALVTALVCSAILLGRAYRLLPMKIYGLYLLPSLASSIVMMLVVGRIDLGPAWLSLLARVFSGAVLYSALLIPFDREARAAARLVVRKLRVRLAGG